MSNAPAQTPFENGAVLLRIAVALERIAEHVAPPAPDKVGTPYVAKKLGCTTVWIAEQIRSGQISKDCVVPGTGNGKPWKFYRWKVDGRITGR